MIKHKKSSNNDEDPFSFIDDKEPVSKVKKGWPLKPPHLCADNLTYDGYRSAGCMDIWQWIDNTFEPDPDGIDDPIPINRYIRDKATIILSRIIFRRSDEKLVYLNNIGLYTTNVKVLLAWQAACWNEMLKFFGYDIPDYLCKYTKPDNQDNDDGFQPQEKAKKGWPKEVPILTSKNIALIPLECRNPKCMDLGYWLDFTFEINKANKAEKILLEVINSELKSKFSNLWKFLSSKKSPESKKWHAECWNKMLLGLGYSI